VAREVKSHASVRRTLVWTCLARLLMFGRFSSSRPIYRNPTAIIPLPLVSLRHCVTVTRWWNDGGSSRRHFPSGGSMIRIYCHCVNGSSPP
jgi:hypothetical protein